MANKFTIIAAFGGFILGIINLFINLHINYFRRGTLKIEVENAFLNNCRDGMAEFQIDMVLSTTHDDIFIRDVFLENDEDFQGSIFNSSKYLYLYSFSKRLSKPMKDFSDQNMKELSSSFLRFRDFKIEKKSIISISIFDVIHQIILPDGRDPLPYDNYRIVINYNNNRKAIMKFDFSKFAN